MTFSAPLAATHTLFDKVYFLHHYLTVKSISYNSQCLGMFWFSSQAVYFGMYLLYSSLMVPYNQKYGGT